MDVQAPTPLLGGLSAQAFMRRHWEKRPLLVRQAWPGVQPPLSRKAMFDLAASPDVESRLVRREGRHWEVGHGPFARRALPAVRTPRWTLLVQGLDLHVPAAHAMLAPFRFVPEARLDDLMMSWASDGGGVGPHVDAYDVFVVQVHGRRRWRVGRVRDDSCIEGLPLKILRRFEPEFDWVLEPGDLLYLPPLWGHDGIGVGECMTCSIGFRSPRGDELAAELLQRLAEPDPDAPAQLYRDPAQPATARPGEIPTELAGFARRAVDRALTQPQALERALGEALTEPKPRVWFDNRDGRTGASLHAGVRLDHRSRMLYDARHVYLNGESFRAAGRDLTQMRRLADTGALDAAGCTALSTDAAALVQDWLSAGWLQEGAP